VGTPYGPPSGCATRNDFTIEKVIGPNNGCTGTGIQSVRISYAKGAAARPMTVELYYPGEFLSFNKTTSVQFAIGESDKIICISDKILVRSIKVRSVTCTGPAINTCIAGGSSDQLMLSGNVQQLASNKFQQSTPAGLVTTYTIVAGKQNQPPADATYCTDGVLIRKDFYNCFKLYMPNSTIPVQFFNVWVVGCQKNLCATVAEYTFEYQLSQYKYYDNGRYYYVKLQSGEGEQCGSSIDWRSCIRVNGQIFLNAGISSCDACSGSGVQQWNLGEPITTNPLVYSDGNGGTIEVFPNTAANSNPAARCANPYSREWYPCLKISNRPTLFNASVARCAPDPCASGEPIYTSRYEGLTTTQMVGIPHYYDQVVNVYTDFWFLVPGTADILPEWPIWGPYAPYPTSWHFFSCVKAYVNGALHATYQNVWIMYYHFTFANDGLEHWMPNPRGLSMITGGDTIKMELQIPENFIAFNYKSPNDVTTGKYSFQFNNSWMASPCPEAYGYKKARFPEFNYQYGTSSQDLQGIQDENNGIILGQIKSNCEAQADKWMEKLEACVAPYGDAKMQELKAKLIEVCMNGGDLDHPYGASTVKPGTTGTASFKDAILQVLGLNALTMTCNPWLLDEPHPYDPKTQSVSKTIGATNASLCARVQELKTEAGGGPNLFNYLKNKYGDAMNLTSAQVDILLKSCDNCRYLLEKDIPLPVFMEPGAVGCITVAEYNNGKTAFAAEMGSNLEVDHANYQDMLTNYLNHRWGFSMAYHRYQEFEASGAPMLCSNPPYTEVEVDRYTCVKTVVAAAIVNGRRDYDQYIAEEKRLFRLNYATTCGKAQASSKLTTKQQTYHYTLFYYDQAGNLVRTVSPEGVRFLSDEEINLVDEFRKTDEVVDCSAFGTPATESKTVAFNAFSSALQSNNVKSMELWLNGNGAARQVRFVTPDNKYFYQAAITNNKLWVELYSMTPATPATNGIEINLSNQAVADITGITLQPWSHIFIQSNDFTGSPWDLYLDGRKLNLVPNASALPYPFDWEISATSGGLILPVENIGQLKHLRIYNRFASDPEMAANFGNQCQAPEGQLSIRTNPQVLWARLNMPSTCNNTTNTRVVGNRGALQVSGNLNANYGLAFNDINNTFTVEMWVKPQTTHQLDAQMQSGLDGTTGQKYAIYPTTYTAASGKAGMGISVGTNGVSVYEHADGYMPPLLVWPGSVTAWTHIAVVYNNGTPTLYVNGNWAATGLPSAKQVSPSYNFCSGPYGNMTGNLDEVRVWNVARSQVDINADFRRSIPPSTAGLVAYWPMSREDGAMLYDMSCAHIPVKLNSNYSWTTATSPVADVVPLEYSVLGLFPRHRLVTSMAYNSGNNVVQQKSPDRGHTYLWYDELNRLIASQNEEQRSSVDNPNRYTYNLYEPTLGRTVEVGEKSNGKILPAPGFLTQQAISEFLNSRTNTQINQTIYDKIPATGSGVETGLLQENLRKQVSAAYYKETQTSPVSQAIYYSYDLAGKVKTIWKQVDGLALKRMDYEYDLVSGKTNFVRYQDGQNDRFYYAYKYDAENNVIESYSGTEARVSVRGSTLLNGQLDAFYQYYLHGPLARIELGQRKVQGIDYAYTLHGWLKGVNGHKLNATAEMGNDGNSGNNPMAKDVMAYALGYYNNDYKPIGTGAGAFSMNYAAAPGDITGNELFNGNISNTTVALDKLRNGDPVGYTYRYDQLNRLKEMRYHPLTAATTTWDNNTRDDNAYMQSLTYDGNGNILKHIRKGANTGNMNMAMDDLTYNYKKETDFVNNQDYYVNNQLQHVQDAVDESYYKESVNGVEDLDNQDPENYKYDKVGNLVKDVKSNIEKISWTIYGKVSSVRKTDGTEITYTYDPSGNRVKKVTTVNNVPTTTWYSRDAQGNTMAVYSDKQDGQAGTWWKEQHLYSTSRIGIWSPGINIAGVEGTTEWGILGKKTYELTNHLRNVIATITDKKMVVSSSGTTVDHYAAEVTSAQDYYPFGMLQPGRSYNAGKYRYGFNGKENDNEVKGIGNSIDFGDRSYDPRLGRWLSLDPLMAKYPGMSPYNFAAGNPILYIDKDGQDYVVSVDHATKTITIKATYHAVKGAGATLASEGVTRWNNQNGKYQYVVGEGDKAVTYQIKFDLKVKEHKTVAERDAAFKADKSGGANKFASTEKDLPVHGKSFSDDGKKMNVNSIIVENTAEANKRFTPAHEVGHTLSLEHWSKGLMENGVSRTPGEGANYITIGNISSILNYAKVGELIVDRTGDEWGRTDNATEKSAGDTKAKTVETNKDKAPANFGAGTVTEVKTETKQP
jgi:RHS repeat-associated protein